MITSCGIYCCRMNGVLNVPFVALNADDAIKIVKDAFFADHPSDDESDVILSPCDIVRIGSLHFTDGIIDTDQILVVKEGESL